LSLTFQESDNYKNSEDDITESILILSNEMQNKAVYLLFCKFILHVSGVNHTHHQEHTKL